MKNTIEQKSSFLDSFLHECKECIHTISNMKQMVVDLVFKQKKTESKNDTDETLLELYSDFDTILGIADVRDPETGEHVKRLGILSAYVSQKLGKDEKFIKDILIGAPLHDIGKITTPNEILLKQGKLTHDEFEIMKNHTSRGSDLLNPLAEKYGKHQVIDFARNIILYHHEKYDGTGYPYGLVGKDIPIEARIVALVDVFDALKSKRPYKEVFSDQKTIEILEEGRGKHFDPEILDIFLLHWDEILELRSMNEDREQN